MFVTVSPYFERLGQSLAMLGGFPTCKEAPDMILNFLLGVVSSKGFGYLRVARAMNDHKVTFLSFQTHM